MPKTFFALFGLFIPQPLQISRSFRIRISLSPNLSPFPQKSLLFRNPSCFSSFQIIDLYVAFAVSTALIQVLPKTLPQFSARSIFSNFCLMIFTCQISKLCLSCYQYLAICGGSECESEISPNQPVCLCSLFDDGSRCQFVVIFFSSSFIAQALPTIFFAFRIFFLKSLDIVLFIGMDTCRQVCLTLHLQEADAMT